MRAKSYFASVGRKVIRVAGLVCLTVVVMWFQTFMIQLASGMLVRTSEDLVYLGNVTTVWEAVLGWSILWICWLLWEWPLYMLTVALVPVAWFQTRRFIVK